ncbi:MAG: NAD-dependent protein deacylase [Akkermansiaceae bacterium]|nr:NAD-dependent protein deacylase [Akkermansiaceae bacterium]
MKIVILTGAGISAESGVPTFRGPDGLWEGHRVEDVATPEAFRRDPVLVQRFYNMRRRFLLSGAVHPNPAHLELARLALQPGIEVTLVTQNIDDLHERAGSAGVLHMHGELLKARCEGCGETSGIREDLEPATICPECGEAGRLRPDVVWFGEMPYFLEEIGRAVEAADWFVSIGTSGLVYPAAGYVSVARDAGVRTLEINLDESATSGIFDDSLRGPAGEQVPRWVAGIIAAR